MSRYKVLNRHSVSGIRAFPPVRALFVHNHPLALMPSEKVAFLYKFLFHFTKMARNTHSNLRISNPIEPLRIAGSAR
jgi:hypothetical protein